MKAKIDFSDLPERPEWLQKADTVLQEKIRQFSTQQIHKEEAVVLEHMPLQDNDKFDIEKMICTIDREGVKTYYYAGDAFLRIWPPEFETVHDGDHTKIVCTQKYKDLRGI